MPIKEWITYETINGKEYKIFNFECDYYGGSKILTSRMELVNANIDKKNNTHYKKNLGEDNEKRRRTNS